MTRLLLGLLLLAAPPRPAAGELPAAVPVRRAAAAAVAGGRGPGKRGPSRRAPLEPGERTLFIMHIPKCGDGLIEVVTAAHCGKVAQKICHNRCCDEPEQRKKFITFVSSQTLSEDAQRPRGERLCDVAPLSESCRAE